VLVVALMVGIAAAFTRMSQPPQGAEGSSGSGSSAATIATQPPSAAMAAAPEASSVPLIAVDSLPVAARGVAAKGNGRLSVAASPGWCAVSVDGIARGVTPLASVELAAGAHRVDCVPPSGKPRTASISVAEGNVTRQMFSLDE
jgi:hypothetical protein